MKFTSYQKIVLGYQTIVSMLRQRGFDTTDLEKELSNITEERVDEFLESFQTRKKQFGGADDSDQATLIVIVIAIAIQVVAIQVVAMKQTVMKAKVR